MPMTAAAALHRAQVVNNGAIFLDSLQLCHKSIMHFLNLVDKFTPKLFPDPLCDQCRPGIPRLPPPSRHSQHAFL